MKKLVLVALLVVIVVFGSACELSNTISRIMTSETPTATHTATSTATQTATATATSTSTATLTSTATATSTATDTATPTSTATLTETPLPTRTLTKAPPKPTKTPTPSEGSSPVNEGGEGGVVDEGGDSVGESSGGCNGADSSMESSVLSMINSQRSSAGMGSVQYSSSLSGIARSYSQSMAESGFFSHGDLSSRVNGSGSYSAVGEILYAGPGSLNSASSAISTWLNSPMHREQLLNPVYTLAGVGYWCAPNSQYEGYFTVDFARP